MKKLPTELRKRAESLLHAYGGLEGFSKNPPWLIDIVLKTWFTEAERRKLLDFLLKGVKRGQAPDPEGDRGRLAPSHI